MKQFYNMFSDEKVSPMATQLTWSHYSELLSIKDINIVMYYIDITISNNLSKRELRERIKNKEYERLPNEEVLKTLNDSKIYRTDIDGTILFKLSKNKMKIKTYPP